MTKQHLNTLYVMTQGAYLSKQREAVLVNVDGEVHLRMPVHSLEGIVCFGRVGVSPGLLGLCGERGVAVSFLTEHGRFLASARGFARGSVLVRREQYRRADDTAATLAISQSIVVAKVLNSRNMILRSHRDHGTANTVLIKAARRLKNCAERASRASGLDEVRGLEGEAGRIYFDVFNELILTDVEGFNFNGRSRRPPRDRVNAVLSFLYAVLSHDVRGACETAGVDPAVGFLHRDRPGRPGLALDLMEELRAPIADRLMLTLINRRQISPKHFDEDAGGSVLLTDKGRKKVLVAYQKRKADEITHPFLEEKTTVGLLMHLQARLLSRMLRGELDAYPPLIWK